MRHKLANQSQRDLWCSVVFFLIAAAMSYVFVARPGISVVQARTWPAVSCTIVSSSVETNGGKSGPIFSVDIVYAYEINAIAYKTNRYDFLGGSSSDYESKAAIVKRHRPRTQETCYVNPANPADAVLNRGFPFPIWLGLIPLSGVIIGLFGIVSAIRKGQSAR